MYGLITILILGFTSFQIDKFLYSKELSYYPVSFEKDSVVTIGIIGDSWVADNRMDSLIHFPLLASNINNRLISSGQKRAKSKIIYQNLFKDKSELNSSKFIVENHPDFCIVVAGVNDATGQIGSHYYSYHLTQIIKTLLNYKIKPIIVSLPEFGVEVTPENMNLPMEIIWKYRNHIYASLNNNGEIDNISTYRKALLEELELESLKDSVIIIDFDKVCTDYHHSPKLYSDRGHLSDYGNEKLCKILTDEIITTINAQ
jgi:lysophospholipase L1-like esterase